MLAVEVYHSEMFHKGTSIHINNLPAPPQRRLWRLKNCFAGGDVLDWFIHVSEIEFGICFHLLNMVCLLIGWFVIRSSNGKYSPPDINSLDPIAFAALREGDLAALDTAVVQLMARQIIKIEETLDEKWLSVQTATTDLSPVEKAVCEYIMIPKEQLEFIDARCACQTLCTNEYVCQALRFIGVRECDESLRYAVNEALVPIYRQYQEQGLLISNFKLGRVILGAILFWDGLALVKVLLEGVTRHHASVFLPLAMLVWTIAYISLFLCRCTQNGARYVAEVKTQFSKLPAEWKSTQYVLEAGVLGVDLLVYARQWPFKRIMRSGQDELADNPLVNQYRAFAQIMVNSNDCGGCGGCGGGW